jgi:hypothetical protein
MVSKPMTPDSRDKLPRYLYHGTSRSDAEDIIEHGLQPRSATGRSNWDDTETPSIENHVYLTQQYAGHYAKAAEKENEGWAIVEVDRQQVDTERLFPDEDFIEQASSMGLSIDPPVSGETLKERTKFVRDNIDAWQSHWATSLEMLGNISYRGAIPRSAIWRAEVLHTEIRLRNVPAREYGEFACPLDVGEVVQQQRDPVTVSVRLHSTRAVVERVAIVFPDERVVYAYEVADITCIEPVHHVHRVRVRHVRERPRYVSAMARTPEERGVETTPPPLAIVRSEIVAVAVYRACCKVF